LWTWGRTHVGSLGLNEGGVPGPDHSSPVQIPGEWSQATMAQWTGYGIKTDGTLWTWGSNNQGNLGLNSPSNSHRSSPVQVGTNATWTNLGLSGRLARDAFVCKTDGTLWGWGNNENGSLAQNDLVDRSSPCQIPGTTWSTSIRPSKGFYGKVGGAIKTNGSLFTWGANDYGLLGQNEAPSPNYSSPIQVPGTWTGIFYNWEHAMGFKDE